MSSARGAAEGTVWVRWDQLSPDQIKAAIDTNGEIMLVRVTTLTEAQRAALGVQP